MLDENSFTLPVEQTVHFQPPPKAAFNLQDKPRCLSLWPPQFVPTHVRKKNHNEQLNALAPCQARTAKMISKQLLRNSLSLS